VKLLFEGKVISEVEIWTSGRSYRRKAWHQNSADISFFTAREFKDISHNFTRMGRGETNAKVRFLQLEKHHRK
jgi:hypothetical protein